MHAFDETQIERSVTQPRHLNLTAQPRHLNLTEATPPGVFGTAPSRHVKQRQPRAALGTTLFISLAPVSSHKHNMEHAIVMLKQLSNNALQ